MTFQQKLRSEKNQAKGSASLSQFIPSSFFRFGFFCIISIQIFKLYKRGEKVHLRFSSSYWDIQNLMSDLGFAGAVLSIVIHVDMTQVKIWADHVKIIFPWPLTFLGGFDAISEPLPILVRRKHCPAVTIKGHLNIIWSAFRLKYHTSIHLPNLSF